MGSQSRNSFAEVDLYTATVDSWNPMPSIGEADLVKVSGNRLIIGGDFSDISGSKRKNIASFNILNDSLEAWCPVMSISPYSLSITGNEMYICGTRLLWRSIKKPTCCY